MSEKIRILYGNSVPSSIAIIIIVIACTVTFLDNISPIILGGWSSLMLLVAVWRLLLNKKFNTSFAGEKVTRWSRYFTANTFVAGIGWGVLCLFFLSVDQLIYQTIITLVILGIMGASVPLFISHFPAFVTSSLPSAIVLPLMILTQVDKSATILTIALILFISLIYYISLKTSKYLENFFRLQYENRRLVRDLQDHISERKEIQKELEYHQHELQNIVEKRTKQLERNNQTLKQEINERKEAQVEQVRLQRELEQAHKMEALGQLTGGVAHDFNNILGIIMGYISLVKDRYPQEVPKKMKGYLETAYKASVRAKELVAQMLLFSRPGSEDSHPLQLTPLIEDIIKMLSPVIPSSINIEFIHEEDLPPILMEPSKFQQLLINLCVNAKDAMNGVGNLTISVRWKKAVDIECTACHKHVLGDWIEISVSDTGTGMTSETVKHLFEPFFTTKEVGKGTGMGLSVMYGIVSSHGGHTFVETELGVGSNFRVLFPPAHIEEIKMSDNQGLEEHPQGKGQHIIVLDDEADLAEYIGEILLMNNYLVTIKTDSQEVLDLFTENPNKYDLLITDQTMPKLTGLELVNMFKKIRPELPVILCSGYSDTIDQNSANDMALQYLSKPINAGNLIHSVGKQLHLN
ncbi:MAG: response regulator [Gammaproteobacteria bacterium]|nr:response regulator [Gammaproteobacteria bacterium]